MRSVKVFGVFVLAATLVLACGRKPVPPAPAAPTLDRPLLTLDAKSSGRILIPQAALVRRGGIPGVFVLGSDNQARFRMVRPGKIANGRVEILSGLDGNETLVLGDLHDVHDGSPIATR
jgi:hypothetical protein